MKTAGRHHVNSRAPHYSANRTNAAPNPDRIILPTFNHTDDGSKKSSHLSAFEYVDFEEVQVGSSRFDELAFEEFASDDPSRLRRADQVSNG